MGSEHHPGYFDLCVERERYRKERERKNWDRYFERQRQELERQAAEHRANLEARMRSMAN